VLPVGVTILPGTISFQGVEVVKPKMEFSACVATPFAQMYLPKSKSWFIDTEILAGLNLTVNKFNAGGSIGLGYAYKSVKFSMGYATLTGSGSNGQGVYGMISWSTN
jgi:hypothetical protein